MNPTTQVRSRVGLFPDQQALRLDDCVVQTLRPRQYSRRTERAYLHRIGRFIQFYQRWHPRQLAEGDVNRGEITVRQRKGDKDPITTMPGAEVQPLHEHLRQVQAIHQQDSADGYARVELPHALARKYLHASREWCWKYVFPQKHRWVN